MPCRTPSPHPSDIYPTEILEWSEGLITEDVEPTAQQRRMFEILHDDEVMRAAKPVIARLLADEDRWQGEDRLGRLDGFWLFIEQASRLLEQQPPGSHLRYNIDEPLVFSTPGELRQDLAKASAQALELTTVVERTATAISNHFPISDARHLIDLLDAFYEAAAIATATHAENQRLDKAAGHTGTPGLPGSKAGKNGMRNWLLREVGALASLHLRDRAVTLVTEVARVLMEQQEPTEEGTARGLIPNTRLVPVEDDALHTDWRAQISQ